MRPPIEKKVSPQFGFKDKTSPVKDGEPVRVLCKCGAEGIVVLANKQRQGSKNTSIHCTECTNRTRFVRGWYKALEMWEDKEYEK